MTIIRPVPAFTDNYIWLLHTEQAGAAWVVDPGDAAPVIEALDSLSLSLEGILVTHHHFDHTGGVEALCKRYEPLVIGPKNPAIDHVHQRVGAGDRVSVLGEDYEVIEVPGHTLDHIAYFHAGAEPRLFCGDTLFAGGCGRVFEGTPQMMHRSLATLAALPAETRVYCAHEYTLANLAFAAAVEPDNTALQERARDAESRRARGEPTVPSRLGLEQATNPFLRCGDEALRASLARQGVSSAGSDSDVFATVRAWKDRF